ncbi:MAG: amidohydrolase family protein [Anaerolineae bacterium]
MRIDIHTHFIPRDFIDEARRERALDNVVVQRQGDQEWLIHPQGYRYPVVAEFWDLEAKLQHMDGLGIDVSVLSIAPTLFFYWLEAGPALEFCQRANEALAEFVSQSDGRLYGMASVPLQNPEAAATELRRAVTELDLRGTLIGTTMEDVPLDDQRFEPFFRAAEELGVPVVLHPYYVGPQPQFADFYMTNLIGNPLGTCVAAARLILSGFLDRHPDLIVVLVHAGGFLPYQIGRLDHGFRMRSETSAAIDSPPSGYLRRFYFDTITHASRPLEFLVNLAGADRVVLGTDIPFDMADTHFADYLSAAEVDDQAVEAINAGNAIRIFGLDRGSIRRKERRW